ncbi:cyclic AMP-responsive element-binding protein 3-like protein 4 [Paramacrobiotus metropolitanus]|uniref:cyclic AMP-responsive element-binding protein 3-like protein 4 n=1 Tax=Paramacrobiotus metropolitanus TaxID=2943436 RepID=UPI002445FD8E|nr:cyclic AMP-responsive element-binding protein 3-like protein 4 [Paramacrobiotus metropolitanus]
MDQGRGLWDLLFGVSDVGAGSADVNVKMESDDQSFQLELPEDFLQLLNDNPSSLLDFNKSLLSSSTAVSGAICHDGDFSQGTAEESLEVDLASLDCDLTEFLQVPQADMVCSSNSSGSDDGSSSDCGSLMQHGSPKSVHSDSSSVSSRAEKEELVLSKEELTLLHKEGLTLPKFLPLSKQDERVLKKIRRKIRNKKSAQESRRKKKVYVDQLEDQIKDIASQNKTLSKRVKELEKENVSLQAQLKTLQSLLGRTTRNTKTTGTCLMALVLSVALIMTPYGKSANDKDAQADAVLVGDYETENAAPVRTRIMYNLDTPPDRHHRHKSSGLPLAQVDELAVLDTLHAQKTTNSISLDPWEEKYAAHVTVVTTPMPDMHIQLAAPNRSTATH